MGEDVASLSGDFRGERIIRNAQTASLAFKERVKFITSFSILKIMLLLLILHFLELF